MFGWRRKAEAKQEQVEEKSLASPEDWLFELFGAAPTLAGPAVTPANAMRVPAVRCAVQSIAEAIGQLPLIVYRRGDDGSKERAPDHPAYALLHDAANDWVPAGDFREQMTRDALLYGNGFGFINRVDGRPVELIRLRPDAVSVELDAATGEPVYRTSDGRGQGTIARQNILHLRAPSCDGVTGDSPVRQAREAIGLAATLEAHAARLFGRGARPSGLLKFPHKLGAQTAARIKASWQAAHGGENSGRTAVLEEGGDFTPLAFNSVDAQFMEARAFQIGEIARVFRVPPVLLMDFGRATWSNSEEMGRQFLAYGLMRWVKTWEGELRLKMFSPDEWGIYFAEFLLDDLLRADLAQRADAYGKLIAARVLNPNEARAAENRPPYDGGDKFENPNTTSVTITGGTGGRRDD